MNPPIYTLVKNDERLSAYYLFSESWNGFQSHLFVTLDSVKSQVHKVINVVKTENFSGNKEIVLEEKVEHRQFTHPLLNSDIDVKFSRRNYYSFGVPKNCKSPFFSYIAEKVNEIASNLGG